VNRSCSKLPGTPVEPTAGGPLLPLKLPDFLDFDAVFGAPGRRWRDHFRASLQNGIGRYRFEAEGFALSFRSMQELGQGQESCIGSGAANSGRGVGEQTFLLNRLGRE
jgi:hypothetical protein